MSAADLIAALKQSGQTVATCESLTAGLLAATLADVPGASTVLRGGLVTYATELKHDLAGVPQQILAQEGPVSAATAEGMARGARRECGSDWAMALTGVAGPEPQEGHPVGEVFLGIAGPGGQAGAVRVLPAGRTRYVLDPRGGQPIAAVTGNRAEIRRESVDFAIKELLSRVMEQNSEPNR